MSHLPEPSHKDWLRVECRECQGTGRVPATWFASLITSVAPCHACDGVGIGYIPLAGPPQTRVDNDY